MARRGEYGDTTQRCAFCGKPHTTWIWNSYQGRYCSFRCYAADTWLCNSLCLCCLIPISFTLYMALLIVIRGTYVGYGFIPPGSVVVLAIFWWCFTAIFLYTVYIGYITDNPSSHTSKYEEIPPESRNYD